MRTALLRLHQGSGLVNNNLGILEIIQNYKMEEKKRAKVWPITLSGTTEKRVVQKGLKLEFAVSRWPADLRYLHDWPRPCGGPVVVVDIVRSSLRVLPLFPSRGQALCAHCVTCCRGRLAKHRKRANAIYKRERILHSDIESRRFTTTLSMSKSHLESIKLLSTTLIVIIIIFSSSSI